jgi:hypothetical protein
VLSVGLTSGTRVDRAAWRDGSIIGVLRIVIVGRGRRIRRPAKTAGQSAHPGFSTSYLACWARGMDAAVREISTV